MTGILKIEIFQKPTDPRTLLTTASMALPKINIHMKRCLYLLFMECGVPWSQDCIVATTWGEEFKFTRGHLKHYPETKFFSFNLVLLAFTELMSLVQNAY